MSETEVKVSRSSPAISLERELPDHIMDHLRETGALWLEFLDTGTAVMAYRISLRNPEWFAQEIILMPSENRKEWHIDAGWISSTYGPWSRFRTVVRLPWTTDEQEAWRIKRYAGDWDE